MNAKKTVECKPGEDTFKNVGYNIVGDQMKVFKKVIKKLENTTIDQMIMDLMNWDQ